MLLIAIPKKIPEIKKACSCSYVRPELEERQLRIANQGLSYIGNYCLNNKSKHLKKVLQIVLRTIEDIEDEH